MRFFIALLRLSLFLPYLVGGVCIAIVLRAGLGNVWYAQPFGARTKLEWVRTAARILGLRIRVIGEQPESISIWVANHVSWLDVVALNALAPISFIAKQDVKNWPIIGWLTQLSGTVFVDRQNRKSIAEPLTHSTTLLQRGVSVAFFPEGTTSEGYTVLPFKTALFELATQGEMVQPIVLHYRENKYGGNPAPFIGNDAFIGHLWRLLVANGTTVDVIFCAPVTSDGNRKRMGETTHRRIAEELYRHQISRLRGEDSAYAVNSTPAPLEDQ